MVLKQLQPKEGLTLLAVNLPKGACKFSVTSGDNNLHYKIGTTRYIYNLPDEQLELLGIATDIPEEVWQTLVKRDFSIFHHHKDYSNFDYVNNCFEQITATESGMSFLEANEVYSVNPFKNPDATNVLGSSPSGADYEVLDELRDQWEQAEANTGTWLILKRLS